MAPALHSSAPVKLPKRHSRESGRHAADRKFRSEKTETGNCAQEDNIMKIVTGDKDYLRIVGKAPVITENLNKIHALYDLTVVNSSFRQDDAIMVIVERRRRAAS